MVFLTPSEAFAQRIQGFAGLNVGLFSPATKDFQQRIEFDGSVQNDYQMNNKLLIEPTGGVMFNEMIGVAIGFSFYSSPESARTELTLPNLFSGLPDVSDDAVVEEVAHKQNAVHINFLFKPRMPNESLSIVIFGGITRFSVTQELIGEYSFDETLTFNPPSDSIEIVEDTIEIVEEKASGVGFNVGADIVKMLSPMIGVGGTIRFSRGTVDIKDVLEEVLNERERTVPMKVGGFHAMGSIRFVFGPTR
jgi:hypothetical protein